MAYTAPTHIAKPLPKTADRGAYVAYQLLYFGFIVLPILAGGDKFFHVLTDWTKYLAPAIPNALGISANTFMMGAGVIEIIAGLLVAASPRIGGYVIAAWMAGIIGNLAINPVHFWDVLLRDLGIGLAALSLGALSAWASAHEPGPEAR